MTRAWTRNPPQADLETLLELGEGGMARAYLARALGAGGFQRLVVIKRLNLQLLGVRDAVERFLAEARIAGRIHHANVVGTQQIGRDAAGPFIVLDYIEGGSIDDLVERGPLPIPVLLRIALDALAGLQAVHEAREVDGRPLAILHRDVSLQNILVSAIDGVARLSDFGVAKSTLGSVRTDEGVLVGKLVYFPPEYLRREPVGPPLDIYALGVTLWLALAREEPWHGASEAQIIREILDNGMPPLDRYAKVDPPITELVMRACDRDPRRRFQSAREMADVLERSSREPGWLASHADVAATVSEVLGPELQHRRNALSRLTRSSERARSGQRPVTPFSATLLSPGGTERLAAGPRPAPFPETRLDPPVIGKADVAEPARSPWRAVEAGIIVAITVSVALAAVAWGISRDGATEAAPARATDVSVMSAPESARPAALASPDVSPPRSEPAARSSELSPGPADAGPAGQRREAPRLPPSSEQRVRTQHEPTVGRETPAALGSLRKQNPYRP